MGSAVSVLVSIAASYVLSGLVQAYMWDGKNQDGSPKKPWPPSPKGLPFFWNGYEAFRMHGYRALTAWSIELANSKFYSVKLIQKRVLVMNDAALVHKAFVDMEQYNSSRPSLIHDPVEMVMTDVGKTVIAAPFALPWQRLRRAIHKALNSSNWELILRELAEQLCQCTERLLFQKKQEGSSVVVSTDDLRGIVDRIAMTISVRVAIGEREPAMLRTLMQACQEAQAIQQSKWYFRFSPFLAVAKTIAMLWHGTHSVTRLRNQMLNIVLERPAEKGTIADSLSHMEPSKNDPEPVQATADEVSANVVHLILHGYQFLSSALFTLIQRLASMPELQQRLLLLQKDERRLEALAQSFVAESLRYNPPCRLFAHTSRVDHELEGYRVDEGSQLVVNLDRIHFDPACYTEPDVFDPQRFMDHYYSNNDKKNREEHMAFGIGRRACQASRLSRQMMALTVIKLVRHFEMRGGDPSETIDLPSGVWSWTGRTETKGAPIEFIPRSSS